MNRVLIVIFVSVFLVSCGKKQETQVVVNDDSQQEDSIRLAKKQADSIALERAKEQKKWDSIYQYKTDSLRKAIKHIKSHKNINISQRISRIKNLMSTYKDIWGNLYDLYEYEETSDRDFLIGNEIGLLMMDSMIIHYNIDSIFKNTSIYVAHSENNRVCAFSWIELLNGSGNEPANVFFWRDSVGKPQGFKYFEPEYEISYYYGDTIHKLNNTDKDLYILEGGTKFSGGILKGIELTAKGINFNPKLFKTEKGFSSVYFLGNPCGDENDFYYSFNKETQTVTFTNCGDRWGGYYSGIRTTGTLTFNGKYFTEKLKKKKI